MRTNKIISALGYILHQVSSVLNIQESRQNELFMASNDYKKMTEV
ncbi:hypothetical protein [Mariniplasma anaerobium]|uniref:Uncharacterized protein n=1 Tax=Mariniplasma anaerobium TaxID=2735436 RepID=A0A7U9XWH0_9MOLU|nr:hypothetical protein [Mariniplasma anaerobium]BCR35253.1 hypothetical protein MPAN_001460 [Mariniplasma anaerobium]